MAYGTANVDNIQSSTTGTPTVFKDGNGTQIGTLCRAWANWNGSGVINASFNVSSITVNSTGNYTINFTNAFADTKYSATGISSASGASIVSCFVGTKTTTTCGFLTVGAAYATQDYNSAAFFR